MGLSLGKDSCFEKDDAWFLVVLGQGPGWVPVIYIYVHLHRRRFHNRRAYNPVHRGGRLPVASLIAKMQYVAVDGPTEALKPHYIAYQVTLIVR